MQQCTVKHCSACKRKILIVIITFMIPGTRSCNIQICKRNSDSFLFTCDRNNLSKVIGVHTKKEYEPLSFAKSLALFKRAAGCAALLPPVSFAFITLPTSGSIYAYPLCAGLRRHPHCFPFWSFLLRRQSQVEPSAGRWIYLNHGQVWGLDSVVMAPYVDACASYAQ